MDNISALMDGELDGHDAHQALLRLNDTAHVRASWATYHLIGDVMRGETMQTTLDISQRIMTALETEPTVLAPRRSASRPGRTLTYALSAAASISAVAVVGWMAFSTNTVVNPPVEMARVAPSTPATQAGLDTQLVSSPSDGQMNEYLLAHQGVSPSTRLQGVAPYIRTISIAPASGR
jgi:sigma-E factor negative regulatory protein RseA